jgi:putative membrane protein
MRDNFPAGPDQISTEPAPRRAEPARQRRPPLSRAERGAIQAAALALAGFASYGFATGSPSTGGYSLSVLLIGVAIARLRRAVLPGLLVTGLAVAAIMTLAGGLINVGQNVLYNLSVGPYSRALGTHFLQYDHLAHAYVSFVVAFACWVMLAAPHAAGGHRRELVILSVGTALGLGAVNEVVEFTATLAHHGAHAGGYWNTGWDLVCNLIGATTAGIVIATSRAGAA